MQFFIYVCSAIVVVFGAQLPEHKPFSQELIDYVNTKPGSTWKAGGNDHFKNVPLEVFRKMLGARRSNHTQLKVLEQKDHVGDIPDTFDARTVWPECADVIGEVRDQAACGSCWAFGAVEAISDRICIASKGKYKPHISAEDLNSCCKSCGAGCDGGDPSYAWQYYVDVGIVTGSNYSEHSGCQPYSIPNCDHHTTGRFNPCGSSVPTPKCQQSCIKGYPKLFAKDKWYGRSAYNLAKDVAAIQREILTNGPVETGFDVYSDFPSYKSGVYQHTTGSLEGGHAVKVIGWGVESGTPYWLVANSWNTDWGMDGFFKMIRGKDDCGFEDDMTAGLPKLPQ